MHVAGIEAHTTYVVVAIVSENGELVRRPTRVQNARPEELLEYSPTLRRFGRSLKPITSAMSWMRSF